MLLVYEGVFQSEEVMIIGFIKLFVDLSVVSKPYWRETDGLQGWPGAGVIQHTRSKTDTSIML